MNPTDKQIKAFILVIIKGFTHNQAGEIIGISRSAVTRRLKRFMRNASERLHIEKKSKKFILSNIKDLQQKKANNANSKRNIHPYSR